MRGREHLRQLRKKEQNSVMLKHIMTEHETEEKYVEFEMNIVGIFKNPLSRIVNEGVRIKQRKDEELLNSKTEYHGPIVRRKVIETS